jgi:hypothetical protein
MKYWDMLTDEGKIVVGFIILIREAFLLWG